MPNSGLLTEGIEITPVAGSLSHDELSTHANDDSPLPIENCKTACAGAERAATAPPAVAMDRSKREKAFMVRTPLNRSAAGKLAKLRKVKPASKCNTQQQ
jgi:hypothetical protein